MSRFVVAALAAVVLVSPIVAEAGPLSNPLDEDGALALLERSLKHDGVYTHRISLDCVTYGTEETADAYFQFVLRENHHAKCGGDPETDRTSAVIGTHSDRRPLRSVPLGGSRTIITRWHTSGWNRRRDRSVRRLRNQAAYREQPAYQGYLRGHLRRLGCDRASLFPCLALTQSRHLVASLALPLFISCPKMTREALESSRVCRHAEYFVFQSQTR
jgi:hypothetical protein